MREVGVHDDDEVARRELQAVGVGRAKAEFGTARPDLDAGGAVDLLKLLGDFLRAVWGSVIDNDEFPLEIASAVISRASGAFAGGGATFR